MFARTLVVWFGLLGLAIVNGGVREALLLPRAGRTLAQTLSTVTLSALIFAVAWFTIPWIAPRTLQDAWTIGVLWFVLTVGFELLGGHYLFHKSWTELLADYDIFAGRIWVLVLITLLVSPIVTFTTRGQ